MFDDTNNDVLVEMQQQESTETNEVQQEQPQVQQPQEDSRAVNMRNLREAKEKSDRERDEALRMVQELNARYGQQKQVDEDDTINLGPDDLAEGKHLSKVDRKIKKLEERTKQYEQQMTALSVEQKLKNDFPNIEKVVTKENIATLQSMYPDIAQTLGSSQDAYSVGSAAYTLIKKLGIYQEDNFEADRERAQKNANKPRPLASVSPQQGDSPLSRANAFANGLTDELKEQLRKEMYEARKAM